jgi:hypothetical protein
MVLNEAEDYVHISKRISSVKGGMLRFPSDIFFPYVKYHYYSPRPKR